MCAFDIKYCILTAQEGQKENEEKEKLCSEGAQQVASVPRYKHAFHDPNWKRLVYDQTSLTIPLSDTKQEAQSKYRYLQDKSTFILGMTDFKHNLQKAYIQHVLQSLGRMWGAGLEKAESKQEIRGWTTFHSRRSHLGRTTLFFSNSPLLSVPSSKPVWREIHFHSKIQNPPNLSWPLLPTATIQFTPLFIIPKFLETMINTFSSLIHSSVPFKLFPILVSSK